MIKRPLTWLAVATLTAGTALAQENTPPVPPSAPAQPSDHQAPPPPPPAPGERGAGPEGPGHGHHPGETRRDGPGGGDGDFADHARPRRENDNDNQGPQGGRHHEHGMMLGVGVEGVPRALADQLSLPEGFGVLVNFVVPGSSAAIAGVQPDDVLKMLNDQILVNPEQLSTLVRSYPEGQEVTLTAIRKEKEVKWTVKLKKEAFPEGRRFGGQEREGEERGFMPREGERGERMLGEANEARGEAGWDPERFGPPGPPAPPVRDIMRELRPELRQLSKDANQKAVDQLQREITILRERNGSFRGTKLDIQDARIVIRDDKGELELKSDAGKRDLTAKDPQGKVVFNGPVNTPDERKAVPADILPRLEKLEKDEMPAFPEAPAANGTSAASSTSTAGGASTGAGQPASSNSF